MKTYQPIGAIAGLAFLSIAAFPAQAAGDTMLFGHDPGQNPAQACFVRHYTQEHLASHPDQNVQDMMLFVNSFIDEENTRQYNLDMGVSFRNVDTRFFVSGFCGASVDGKETLSCGIECDGGHIDVQTKDANALLVAIPHGARTWDPDADENVEDNRPEGANFGLDDKLFRLDRTDLAVCLPVVHDDALRAEISAKK